MEIGQTGGDGRGEAYRKERHESVPFELLSLGVCKPSPGFLKRPHFISGDRFCPPSQLENIREVFHNHTCVPSISIRKIDRKFGGYR
jgi:hypothetical protein